MDGIKCALNTSVATLAEALKLPDADKYLECAVEEVKAHLENRTWEIAERETCDRVKMGVQSTEECRRVNRPLQRKKGYSRHEGIDYMETFAPTARFGALRTIIALAAIEDMELELSTLQLRS